MRRYSWRAPMRRTISRYWGISRRSVAANSSGVLATLAVGVIGVFFIQPILVGAMAYTYRRLSAGGVA
jgi:hypothetical protein